MAPVRFLGGLSRRKVLAESCRGFEHVAQCRDEGIDAAAHILQIHHDHIAVLKHRVGRPAYFAVQTEHRNTQSRIEKISRLNHVVLLVAAQTMLRAESRGKPDLGQGMQRIETMNGRRGCRRWMREQGDASSRQGAPQFRFGYQAIDSEFHAGSSNKAAKDWG